MNNEDKLKERFRRQESQLPPKHINDLEVVIIGCGAVGSNLAYMLANMGINNMHLIDPDIIEESNVGNQGFYPASVGRTKVIDIYERLKLIAEDRKYNYTYEHRKFSTNMDFKDKIIFMCIDNMTGRYLFEKAYLDYKTCDISLKPKCIIDTRMGNGLIRIVTDNGISDYSYYKSLCQEEEAVESGCTTGITLCEAMICAGLAVKQMTRIINNAPFDNDFTCDLRSNDFAIIKQHYKLTVVDESSFDEIEAQVDQESMQAEQEANSH